MNKFLRLGLPALALMFVFNILAVTETKAQLNDILKTMDAHNKALTSLKANVTMEKFNAQLDETDTFTGSTMYLPKNAKREMYARIDWEKPRLNQVIEGTTEKSKNNAAAGGALAFMSMSKNELKANYNVRYLGQESVSGSVSTWHLELTPKTKTTYKIAELWVDGNGMPVQAKVIENNNDSTTVFLSKLQKNVDIPGIVFSINVPKSAKVIKG
jgi:outer membrane lipoprotein-sorting protein